MLLSRDAILSASDRIHEDLFIPEWDGTVRIIGMSGTDRDAWEAQMVDSKGKPATARLHNFRAKLVSKCIVDEAGERVFTDADVKALGAKNGQVIDRIFDVARRLSGMDAAAVEDAAGNSESGRSDVSTSA
ncbi:hypothetical protein [Nocardiopsis alba]|uniref:hypothetical protein n=1 Tax=Nocardiopsis alba TaxID=53437 RepID=UPI003D720771